MRPRIILPIALLLCPMFIVGMLVVVSSSISLASEEFSVEEALVAVVDETNDYSVRSLVLIRLSTEAMRRPGLCLRLAELYDDLDSILSRTLDSMYESEFHTCGRELPKVLTSLREKQSDNPRLYMLLGQRVLEQNPGFVKEILLGDSPWSAAYLAIAIHKSRVRSLAPLIAEAVLLGQDLDVVVPAGEAYWKSQRGDLYGRMLLDLRDSETVRIVDKALLRIRRWALEFMTRDDYDHDFGELGELVEEIDRVLSEAPVAR